jgi:hypothetical protein
VEGRVIGASGLPKGRDAADRLARLPAGSAAGAALDTAALTSDPDVSRALEFLDAMDGSASGSEPNSEDIRNLLTGTAVLGLGSVPRGDDVPRFALRLEGVDDSARAEETLGSFVGDDSPPEVRVRRDDTVVLASDSGYGVSVGTATGRTLGQDELFRQAMSGAPDQVLGAAYVAVQPFVAAADPGDVPDLARSLQAVGLTVGSDGDEIVLHARLIFG